MRNICEGVGWSMNDPASDRKSSSDPRAFESRDKDLLTLRKTANVRVNSQEKSQRSVRSHGQGKY